jgi:restriction system protein
MPVPDFQSLLLPMLRLTADGAEHSISDLRIQLRAELHLTDADLAERLPSGQSTFVNRISWSTLYLTRGGALERVSRGIIRITPRGHDLLRNYPDRLTLKAVVGSENVATEPHGGSTPDKESLLTPEEQLANSYDLLRQSLSAELLEAVRKSSPVFFEKLVVDLLVAMGYGAPGEDMARVLGRTGDGGVDGVIQEDKLGLEVVYVQAKRWEGTVGRPVVQAFAGSLEGQRARKGVMITTSDFSREAKDYVEKIGKRIVLIDGKRLALLMLDHGVAVTDEKIYRVQKIDNDYFEDL